MGKGTWFQIPGIQDGERSIDEQLLGLESALAEASAGKTVWDLGCAEGAIAFAFMKAGATVEACDFNNTMIETALNLRGRLPDAERRRIQFRVADLRYSLADGLKARFDIVLALAVVHKLPKPEAALGYIARAAKSLVVIRLPGGSQGRFLSKNYRAECDVNATMPGHGFVLEQAVPGPRDERVQYWRRR